MNKEEQVLVTQEALDTIWHELMELYHILGNTEFIAAEPPITLAKINRLIQYLKSGNERDG